MNRTRVLIVDDDPAILDAFQVTLDLAGYDVLALTAPDTILDKTASIPDIYILDRQLGGVDGLDTCRFIKRQPVEYQRPVIMISASPNVARLAKDAGADGFLEKPFRLKELIGMVEAHVLRQEPDL